MLYYSCKFMKINQGDSHGFIPCFPLFKASRAMDSLLVFPGVIFIMQQRNILILKKKKLDGKASKLPPTMTYERHDQVNKKKKKTNQDLEILEAQYVSPSLSLDDSLLTIVTLERIHYMKSLIFSANNSNNIRH